VPTATSATIRRKRCLNCNKFFTPKRNVVKKAKFCKDACRKEFWKHGSSFGPIKVGLYAAIDKKYAALEKETKKRLREMEERWITARQLISSLTRDVCELRSRLTVNVEPAQADARSR
jgi:hypothetical protein